MKNHNMLDFKKKERIYQNKKNYIYKINETYGISTDKEYLLFNPYIHYWVKLDEIGKFICEILNEGKSLTKLKEEIINKYSINIKTFKRDVFPFINELLKHGFYKKNKVNRDGKREKNNQKINMNNYPFNDLYIRLTDQCNLNCIFCFNKDKRKIKKENNVSEDLLIKAIQEFKKLGGNRVVFTGGEPTICESKLTYLGKTAKNIGLKTSIITNGTLLSKINLNKLILYIDQISISLDSTNNKILRELWGTSRYKFEDINDSIKKIDLLAKKLNKKLLITIMPIVTSLNIDGVVDIIKKVSNNINYCKYTWSLNKYGKIKCKNVDKKLNVNEEKYSKILIDNYDKLYDKKLNSVKATLTKENKIQAFSKPKKTTCAPSFFIITNGDVFPCQGFELDEYKLGNINNNSLKEISLSNKFRKLILDLNINNIKKCKKCELRYVCSSYCPAEGYKETDEFSPSSDKLKNCKDVIIKLMWLKTIT
ncbi:MAG: radical SAM protein [Candidatus Mcinerneyibacterium aminivorans]|uniref:Radical SAM protein n=1 Tax=Candidatus Mcinerneyibacterium aminivorans TaxID=2703815 RepID=A0A5D0M963_9BACT|nr:MAG: radical SAM protein [Candidatus Mcinerneyibacterium aminivorans]